MNRHSTRCKTCNRFVKRGLVRCVICPAPATVVALKTTPVKTRNPGRNLGHLSRRDGMAEFVPEYYVYARRAYLTFLATVLLFLCCR